MAAPEVKPRKVRSFECKQSRYPVAPRVPLRACVFGPSGAGKGVLLQSMILDVYRGCFERVYVWSPSVHLDHTWAPVRQYVEKVLEVDVKREPCFFDHYDEATLAEVIGQQEQVAMHCKARGKRVYSVLIVVDDFADEPAFSRNSRLLHSLFTRGRHSFCSTVVSSQKLAALSPIIRVNATALFVFRLRNQQDLDMFLTETGALVGKEALLRLYQAAVDEPWGFLFVDLTAASPAKMFYSKLSRRLVPGPSG